MLSDKSVQAITTQLPHTSEQNRTGPAPIDTRSSVTMDAIKSYMLRHGLHAGDRLPTESALCADLGVSRSSVREALRPTAVHGGFVEVRMKEIDEGFHVWLREGFKHILGGAMR